MADAKRQTPAHLRQLTEGDLQKQLAETRQALWNMRAKLRTGSLQQHHAVRQAKRQLAKILTALREKQQSTTPAQAGAK